MPAKILFKWATDKELLQAASEIYADDEYGQPWQGQFIHRCDVAPRTFQRWNSGQRLPGPVRAMIIAHSRCKYYGISF